MRVSLPEAIEKVSAPGQLFEVVERTQDQVTNRVFKNAPLTMREFFTPMHADPATFIVYEDEHWSFSRVADEADALGSALVQRYGVAPGDRVAIAMRNLPEWIISYIAILSIGAIAVPLNAWWTDLELGYALEDSRPAVLIGDETRVQRTHQTCAYMKIAVIAVRTAPDHDSVGVDHWDDILVRGALMPEVTITPDSDATILYTSGTTGHPKGAVSTHGAISQAVMAFSSGVALATERRQADSAPDTEATAPLPSCFILVVPLFHVTGCIPVMLSCVAWHFKLVMMHHWDPERALELIERERVTQFVGVPTQAWDLISTPNFTSFDTSSLTSVAEGGAPAPPLLVKRLELSFPHAPATLGYGLTETNAYGPANVGDDYLEHPTSTGRTPTIVMDAQIRNGDSVLGPNVHGDIWLKSPTLIRGYWQLAEVTASRLVDGWLHTGDVGRIDPEGYLYIEDRETDMILRAGENVYCAEVEAAIYEYPGVHETAVFGVPNERLGEEVACAVLMNEGHPGHELDLLEYLGTRLAAYKVPSRVIFTDAPLLRNATGKFLKREMPATYFPEPTA
jgi:long-chain acyl-CoA synthetase